MTYCVGLSLQGGLVMLSDSRTNAGVDNIATFGKMRVFENVDERVLCLLSAGNLALTQIVVSMVSEGFETSQGQVESLYTAPTMFHAAQIVGDAIRQVYRQHGEAMKAQNVGFDISLLIGGQIRGQPTRLFQVYAAGNFIEATEDTPFLQIGEHKYGKPILDRAVRYATDLSDAVKLALVSMDSTLRSNLTVGLPIDLLVYKKDTFRIAVRKRITEDDAYFRNLRELWSSALRDAYRRIPQPEWPS
jgi:putative proteasome-type protease